MVEDEAKLANLLRRGLRREGMAVDIASDAESALVRATSTTYDVILLDVMLPGSDGLEVCRALRAREVWSPTLMLTALGEVDDRVRGLDSGADDYLTKPFSIDELLARIAATLRRTRPAPVEMQSTRIALTDDLEMDLANRQVTRDGTGLHLTPTEFALLRELVVNRGKLLTHAQLLRRVWGPGYETETEYVRVYVRRLRAKLEPEGSPPLILTQPRVGYRLAPE